MYRPTLLSAARSETDLVLVLRETLLVLCTYSSESVTKTVWREVQRSCNVLQTDRTPCSNQLWHDDLCGVYDYTEKGTIQDTRLYILLLADISCFIIFNTEPSIRGLRETQRPCSESDIPSTNPIVFKPVHSQTWKKNVPKPEDYLSSGKSCVSARGNDGGKFHGELMTMVTFIAGNLVTTVTLVTMFSGGIPCSPDNHRWQLS